jgi:hypothetical protein
MDLGGMCDQAVQFPLRVGVKESVAWRCFGDVEAPRGMDARSACHPRIPHAAFCFFAWQKPACKGRGGCENEGFAPNSQRECSKILHIRAGTLTHSRISRIQLYTAHREQEMPPKQAVSLETVGEIVVDHRPPPQMHGKVLIKCRQFTALQ